MTSPKAEELFLQNEKLIYHILKRYRSSLSKYLFEELEGEARVGLWKACRTFKPEKGFLFSTYATRVIKNQIKMFLRYYFNDCRRIPDSKVIGLDELIGEDGDVSLHEAIGVDLDLAGDLQTRQVLESLGQPVRLTVAGYTQQEISSITGLSQSTVSRELTRSQNVLLREFGSDLAVGRVGRTNLRRPKREARSS
jgi:RNA polymerase sporulation-specific sigma factor